MTEPQRINIPNLLINFLRKARYERLIAEEELDDNQLYATTDANEQCVYGDLYGNIEDQHDLYNALYSSRMFKKDMCDDPRSYAIILSMKEGINFSRDEFNAFFDVTEGVTVTDEGIYDGRDVSGTIVTKNNIDTSLATSFEMNLKFMASTMVAGINENLFTITNSTYRSHQNNGGYNLNLFSTSVPSWASINVTEGDWLNYNLYVDYTQNTSTITLSKDGETLATAEFDARRFNNKIYLCNYFDVTEHGMKIDLKDAVIKLDDSILFECIKEIEEDTYPLYNITIPYYVTRDGVKIVDVQYKDRVDQLYDLTGQGNYIIIDETNEEFRLPLPDIYSLLEKNTATFTLRKWED